MTLTAKETRFHGHPVLEILEDGAAFGADRAMNEHFGFGVKKAQLILLYRDEIESFANTDGAEPRIAKPIERRDASLGECVCEKHSEFEAYGEVIERPYLEMEGAGHSIGLGVTKADAVLRLESEIRDFVEKHAG